MIVVCGRLCESVMKLDDLDVVLGRSCGGIEYEDVKVLLLGFDVINCDRS